MKKVERKCVGFSYYKGKVYDLKLVRENDKVVDENAIKVVDGSDVQVGYIKKEMAKKLAPFLDKFAEDINTIVRTESDVNHNWYIKLSI